MDITKSGEFFTALQKIEGEIIAKLRKRVPVTAANLKWNREVACSDQRLKRRR